MAYATITSRKINVAMKLGNRQDLLLPAPNSGNTYSRISGWLRDAYISVGMSQTFSETESTMTFSLVQGQDTYTYPTSVRAIKSLVGINQDTGASIIVDWKDINYVRRYSSGTPLTNGTPFQSIPSIVADFGNNLIFRPVPDNSNILFYMDNWTKPIITTDVDSTQLQVPDDWLEIIDYEATLRGHAELLERDKGREMMTMLWGYTDPSTGSKTQGIIDRLGNRKQAQVPYAPYGIQPKYNPGYTSKR